MAKLKVSANRMENLKLKRRRDLAVRGHKLLKDKQDELMRNFLELIGELKGLRDKTEDALIDALRRFTLANCELSPAEQNAVFAVPGVQFSLEVETKRLMNLRVPHFKAKLEGNPLAYSMRATDSDADFALVQIAEVLELLLRLAEAEKKMALLADELDRTRRRVNALEYTLIPDLKETIKYITQKLEELERGNLVRLMKVKEIIEADRE
ncbi:MAG TPA: V-type ATP synthase subunit D [candidate division Zixibacteria bacterium]|nr:V-type ATP synthase subunit D [candidate division Zixibacteria bacterium]